MAGQIYAADDPHGDKRVLLTRKANELATRPGWDLQRALSVLEETAWEGRKYLAQDKVRELFEREAPERLLFRVDFTRHLFSGALPLYSLEELEKLTEAFIEHLQKNRDELIQTGYTWNRFQACHFLNWRLNRHYFTGLPMKPTEPPDARIRGAMNELWKAEHPDREVPKQWNGWTAPLDVNLVETMTQVSKKGEVSELRVPGLKLADEDTLKALREKLFNLKIAILETLLKALQRRRSDGLWDECLELLTRDITGDEAEFLIRMDRLYLALDIETGKETPGRLQTPAGGLSDLLVIIAHYEEELESGPWSGVREVLDDLCDNGRVSLPADASESYFGLLRANEGEQIDEAMTVVLSNPPRNHHFWGNFWNRAKQAFRDRFRDRVGIEFDFERQFIRDHWSELNLLFREVTMRTRRTGKVPDLDRSLHPSEATPVALTAELPQLWTPDTGLIDKKERKRLLEIKEEINKGVKFIGESPAVLKAFKKIKDMSKHNDSVLLLGETGTGKELIARAIHENSSRRNGPYEVLNCAAMPKDLVESELFGHVKGAFTGAVSDKPGLFEVADSGTLFLDEVAEMPPSTQAKLLRVLEERQIRRVGGREMVPAHPRIIAATNRDIQDALGRGDFRRDLYYRLNVFQIDLPPLRERREDIPLLAVYFLCGKKVDPRLMLALMQYHWPGNVRELRAVLTRVRENPQGGVDLRNLELPMTKVEQIQEMTVGEAMTACAEILLPILKAQGFENRRGLKTQLARLLGVSKSTVSRIGIAS